MSYLQSKRTLSSTTFLRFEKLYYEIFEIKEYLQQDKNSRVRTKKVKEKEDTPPALQKNQEAERLLNSPKLSCYRVFRHAHACSLISFTQKDLGVKINNLLSTFHLTETDVLNLLDQYFLSEEENQDILSTLESVDLSTVEKLVVKEGDY